MYVHLPEYVIWGILNEFVQIMRASEPWPIESQLAITESLRFLLTRSYCMKANHFKMGA